MTNSVLGERVADVPFFDLGVAASVRRQRLHNCLDEVLNGGYLVGGGPVTQFEDEFCRYVGSQHCVSVGNGLDALRIGMEALGIGPGDEVIVPGFTFYATWLAVTQIGATPVPVDVDSSSASLDLNSLSSMISSRTKAILVVHLYGIPADLEALRRIADEAGVFLIEDAAQSHGAMAGDRMTGSVGDFAAFSFYPTKNLGALGDGGAVLTNSSELASVVRRRRSYGQGSSKYEHVDTGWNSRLDTLQAAFLSDALPQLAAQNERRRAIARYYLDALSESSGGVIGEAQRAVSVWHHFVLRTTNRTKVQEHFLARDIHTDVHFPYFFDTVDPMKVYGHVNKLPNSRKLSEEVLSVPIAPWLTVTQVSQVAEALSELPLDLLDRD